MSEKTTKRDYIQEIDLIELFRKISSFRKLIYVILLVSLVAAILIILISPREYRSRVLLLVESSSQNQGVTGLLQQLGGLSGISSLGATNEESLTPELYPEIVKSTPFLLDVLDVDLTERKSSQVFTVGQYLEKRTRKSPGTLFREYTLGLPGKIAGLAGRKKDEIPDTTIREGPLQLTSKQNYLTTMLSERINARQGDLPNTLEITVKLQDPMLSAQLADSVFRILAGYITDYRTQKAANDLEFVSQSHREAEARYKEAQRQLAAFRDRNLNIVTSSAQITEQNLQSEYTLAFDLYSTLSQQLAQAKLKVQEKMPVFRVIEPAKVPLSKSSPRPVLIIAGMLFLGFCISLTVIIYRIIFKPGINDYV